MISATRRVDRNTIFVKGNYLKRQEDGSYGSKRMREDLDIMNEVVSLLQKENMTDKGIYYGQMNLLLEELNIDGCLCLVL